MSLFNETKVKEQVVNHMGEKAYKQTPKEELVFACLTTFVNSSYYEATDKRLDRIKSLVTIIAKKDPEFIAKLAVYARTEFNMRSIFPVLIGELSKVSKGNTCVRSAIRVGTTRIDDLTELASYLGIKKMSSAVKRGIADALNKFDDYQFAKYKAEGKAVKLVDLVNLVHPKANNSKTEAALNLLISGKLKNTETWEAQLSAGKNVKDTFNDLLDQNKLGYMALLRNLRNILKTGDSKLIQKAADNISNPDKVKRSKQLPFRFLSAHKAISENESGGLIKFEKDDKNTKILKDAINKALSFSVENIPLLEGKTLILSDNSGSMRGDGGGASIVSANSKTTTADIANLFATLYWSRAENTMIGLFGDNLIVPALNREQSIIENFTTIQKESDKCGPSTETGAFTVFEQLIERKIKVDRIIIFSDCQIGRGCKFYTNTGKRSDSFNKLYTQYMSVNPDCKVYSVDLKGYGNSMTPDEGMLKITGWSEKIFDIIQNNEIQPKAMIKVVESVQL